MELDSRKKSRRDRMMRSNSFDTQEVREIGQKEAASERRQEVQKDSQEQGTVVRGQREKIQNGQMGDKRLGDEGGEREQH